MTAVGDDAQSITLRAATVRNILDFQTNSRWRRTVTTAIIAPRTILRHPMVTGLAAERFTKNPGLT
jgi:hypothetical protein